MVFGENFFNFWEAVDIKCDAFFPQMFTGVQFARQAFGCAFLLIGVEVFADFFVADVHKEIVVERIATSHDAVFAFGSSVCCAGIAGKVAVVVFAELFVKVIADQVIGILVSLLDIRNV